MDDSDILGEMRMRIGLVGNAMRRPARMPDADRAAEGLLAQALFQVDELSLCPAPGKLPGFYRGEAGGIIAAILKPLQRIDNQRRDGRMPNHPHDAAHDSPTSSISVLPETAAF